MQFLYIYLLLYIQKIKFSLTILTIQFIKVKNKQLKRIKGSQMEQFRRASRRYIQTIIEIIEIQQPTSHTPLYYILLFGIFLLQISSFTLSTDDRPYFQDDKLYFLEVLTEYTSISYTINEYFGELAILIWFFLLSFLTYSILIYIGVLSYLKSSQQNFYLKSKWMFDIVNVKLNIYFTIYPWIFFVTFVESNSGIFVCGYESFLSEYQDTSNCFQKPFYLYFFSALSLIIALVISYIVFFFFRNISFSESNIIRRKYNKTILIITMMTFMMVFSYYLKGYIPDIFKYYLNTITGALYIYDATINLPFSDIQMNKWVASFSSVFFVNQILLLANVELPNFFVEDDLFYATAILSIVLIAVVLATIQTLFDRILKVTTQDLSQQRNRYFLINFLCVNYLNSRLIVEQVFNLLQNLSQLTYHKNILRKFCYQFFFSVIDKQKVQVFGS
ncbi:transmembrane protein, putative (macronuclear) [Tetrahymena thermophila SB210]|uniref:Transmembrane protein, putative n=1 Tax=Tetrahymena thermophila (strain SB210) TaxID=312017 RepID=W7WZS9_TETTS|nr:transmembrane protein, putative [Tetrahymena thermophila SB210]EWS71112.1 transmembrane protein, putative [Tetrahymena thermophila SB210]|eukprot:XP_012656355.1 transmembrane protein, putative [Tetrahymena thermophila SB210]